MSRNKKHFNTLLAHGGGKPDLYSGAVIPPIQTATTFARNPSYELTSANHLYGRDDNDLYRQTETLIANLEAGADSRLFASGMAAISAIFRWVRPGRTIVVQSGIYWGTTLWLRSHCTHSGIALVEVDAANATLLDETIRETAPDLVFLEVPSNPWLAVADIRLAAKSCRSAGALLAVDATAATPLVSRPLELGADLVVHSATKALNGHSDVLAGVVSTRDATSQWWEFLCQERKGAGAILGVFETWLLLRGLRTLSLRIERMNNNAKTIAHFLSNHSNVEHVYYPGLPEHPQHDLAAAQMHGGFGYLLSFLVRGSEEDALKVAGRLKTILCATSLGGVESLIEHRRTLEGDSSGIPENLLRLSVGIEHDEDLIEDLDQALTG
ncbi:MAG: PLP-dependent aspartate aminotransferase family protein [Stappiaceae bacterium]